MCRNVKADGDEGLTIKLKKHSKGGAHNLLNRQAQRSGVNSKNSVRLHEMKLLAWSQQYPGQCYSTYIPTGTKGVARMETKE
jgi:hypothetical protein